MTRRRRPRVQRSAVSAGRAALVAVFASLGGAEVEAQRARQGLLSLDDARIFYEVVGAGDPIIVVHGGPETLSAVILMNPVEPGSRFREQQEAWRGFARTVEDSTELATLMASEGFAARDAATVSQAYRVMFRQTLRDRARIDELELDLAESTSENGPEVARLIGTSLGEVDRWARLPEIQVPTLVLHGRYDLIPTAISQELASTLGRGRLVVLESGHFPSLEARDALLSAVSSLLVDLSR